MLPRHANWLVTGAHWTLCSVVLQLRCFYLPVSHPALSLFHLWFLHVMIRSVLRGHQATILWVEHKGATKEALRHQCKDTNDQEKPQFVKSFKDLLLVEMPNLFPSSSNCKSGEGLSMETTGQQIQSKMLMEVFV